MKDSAMTIRDYKLVRQITRQWRMHPSNIRHAPTTQGGYFFDNQVRQELHHYWLDPENGKLEEVQTVNETH